MVAINEPKLALKQGEDKPQETDLKKQLTFQVYYN